MKSRSESCIICEIWGENTIRKCAAEILKKMLVLWPLLALIPSWGAFNGEARWHVAGSRLLLVLRGTVPVRNGQVIYGIDAVANAGDAVRFAQHAVAQNAAALSAEEITQALGTDDFMWTPPRALLALEQLADEEVSAVCGAVSLLKWHQDNVFGGRDGLATSLAADGRKRMHSDGRSLHPRIDPVAIVIVESADGERCLLGRQSNYPEGMYTCVSGFVEHAESVERAAAREVEEETGVICDTVALVASQPWPIGRGGACELMLGCMARAAAGRETVNTLAVEGNAGSGELEDARWFTREEAAGMLARGTAIGRDRLADLNTDVEGRTPSEAEELRTPPAWAIAYHLIAGWVEGSITV